MLIEQALKEAIGDQTSAGARVHPGLLDQGSDLPAVVFTRIAGAPVASADGQNELVNARFQVDCFAVTYAAAKTLANAIRSTLDATAGGLKAVCEGEIDFYDDAPRTYRVSLDFSCWFTES